MSQNQNFWYKYNELFVDDIIKLELVISKMKLLKFSLYKGNNELYLNITSIIILLVMIRIINKYLIFFLI